MAAVVSSYQSVSNSRGLRIAESSVRSMQLRYSLLRQDSLILLTVAGSVSNYHSVSNSRGLRIAEGNGRSRGLRVAEGKGLARVLQNRQLRDWRRSKKRARVGAMRQTGAAGLGLSPPRFKRLLTIFLDFAGLFGVYCVFTASFVGNSAGMDAGYAGSMTARRDAIGSTTARGRFGHDLGARG